MSFRQGIKWRICVVGMSIETLFDMWRHDEILNFHETYFLKYKTETAKTVQRQLHILHNISSFRQYDISSFRHIFSIDMPTT